MTGVLLVRLDECSPGGLDLPLCLSAEAFQDVLRQSNPGEEPPRLLAPLSGSLRLQKTGRRLLARGELKTRVEVTCDRCLTLAPFDLAIPIDETVDLAEPNQARPPDGEAGEPLAVIDGRVDLAPLAAENFWLAWPFQVLCTPSCRGLCPRCGADLNREPCECAAK